MFTLVYEWQDGELVSYLVWGEAKPKGPTIAAVHEVPPDVAYRVTGTVLVDDDGPYACLCGQEAEFFRERANRHNRRTIELLQEEFPPPEKVREILSIQVTYATEPPKEPRKGRLRMRIGKDSFGPLDTDPRKGRDDAE